MTTIHTPAALKRVRRTQAERRAQAQEKLLESAISLISERGLQGTSLADIGERAGFARSIAAHHFGDKQGLLRALAREIRTGFRQGREAASTAPQEGLGSILWTINFYIAASAKRAKRTRAFYFMLAEALMVGGDLKAELQLFNSETLEFFERQLRRGIELGEIRAGVDPRAQALIILGLLRGLIGQYAYSDGAIDLEALGAQIVDNVRLALQSSP